jgi:hypothetical protein
MALFPADSLRFYLPFPDGVLHYVCAECDALCCRGQGFAGSLSREMGKLLALYPALAGAVTARYGEVITLQTPARACFFLRDDKRCDIEVTHGTDLKPGMCRLFPFNNFARLGEDIVVIAPHFLCPLRVVLPRSGHVAGTHHDIIQGARESFLLDRGDFAATIVSLAMASGQTADSALEQETRFRDGCSDALQVTSFFARLARSSVDADALRRFLERATRVCGVDPTPRHHRDELDDFLLVLAPYWRLKMLPLGYERMLRVLALAEVLIRRVASLSPRPITPQQADQFYTEISPACCLLSHDESPLAVPAGRRQVPPFGTAELIFTAYQALRAVDTSVMAAFEEAFSAGTPTHDRMAILIELGRHYGGPTVPVESSA